MESISHSNTTISIPNWTCNDYNYIEMNISHYYQARTINIGTNSFAYVKNLIIDGLNELRELNIGSNSFTQDRNSYGNDASKSFHILNCESLESIEIGEYSFSDYAGEFELKNLSKLQSLIIGSSTSNSYNFYNTNSLILEGILNIE